MKPASDLNPGIPGIKVAESVFRVSEFGTERDTFGADRLEFLSGDSGIDIKKVFVKRKKNIRNLPVNTGRNLPVKHKSETSFSPLSIINRYCRNADLQKYANKTFHSD